MSYKYNHGPRTTLIASKLPPGKVLYATPGVSDSAPGLESFARRCGDCPAEITIVSAESVGLEWHYGSEAAIWGETYRVGKFCVLANVAISQPETDSKKP